MWKKYISYGLAATILLPAFLVVALGNDADGVTVKLTDLPSSLQQAIQSHVGDGTLDEITKVVEDSETSYDVDITRKGKERSFTVSTQGELLEEEVFFGELSPQLKKGIHSHVGKGTINDIEKVHDGDEITYDVEITRDGKTRDFTVDGKGQLVEMQMFLEELPAALQDAIKKASASGTMGDIYKTIDEGDVSFDVDVQSSGKTRTLSFDASGQFLSEEEDIALSQTPAAVQKSLGGQMAGAKLASLSKVTEDGKITYEAELLKAGKSQYVVVAPDGKVIPPDAD